MSRLNRPLKVWHGILAVAIALVLSACATAIATSARSGALTAYTEKTSLGTDHRYTYVRQGFTNFANSVDQGVVNCGRHSVVVGGGGLSGDNANSGVQSLNSSYPHDNGDRGQVPDGWAIFMDNSTAENLHADVYAVCKRIG